MKTIQQIEKNHVLFSLALAKAKAQGVLSYQSDGAFGSTTEWTFRGPYGLCVVSYHSGGSINIRLPLTGDRLASYTCSDTFVRKCGGFRRAVASYKRLCASI